MIIEGLSEALVNHSDLVQKYFMTEAVDIDEHRLTALHTALLNGGVFVYVPKNVVVEHQFNTLCYMMMRMLVSTTTLLL